MNEWVVAIEPITAEELKGMSERAGRAAARVASGHESGAQTFML